MLEEAAGGQLPARSSYTRSPSHRRRVVRSATAALSQGGGWKYPIGVAWVALKPNGKAAVIGAVRETQIGED
jgi:hypothetical protein